MRAIILCLAASFVPSQAHITTVCSATAPSVPGKAWFIFSTYHSLASPDGQVMIRKPSGQTFTSSWDTSKCESSANYGSSGYGSSYGSGFWGRRLWGYQPNDPQKCPGDDIKEKCTQLPNDAKITCYTGNDPNSLVSVEDGGCEAFPRTSGSLSKSEANYIAEIDGATSGDYFVTQSTTDYDSECHGEVERMHTSPNAL